MNRARLSVKAILLICCIAFGLTACGSSDMATKPTSSGTDASADMRPTVMALKAEQAGRQTRVVLQGNQPMTYTAVFNKVPPTIVVDVGATPSGDILGLTSVKNGLVDKVEVESIPGLDNVSRVKIGLNKATTYQVVREGNNLVVLVENAAGMAETDLGPDETPLTPAAMSGGTAAIQAVDFRPVGSAGKTRLIIRTNKVVTPQVLTRDSGRTVVLSISPAGIAGHLIRPLDTSYFRSAVNYIKPTPSSGRSVEFLIRLRDVVPYHLGQKGLVTYMDFDQSGVAPAKAHLRAPGAAKSTTAAPAAPAAASATTAKKETTVSRKPGEPKVYTGDRISLDFQNADIHNILRLIGDVSGKNVVVSERVTGKVTLKLEEVPWDQALDIVLAANQLGVVESGNVLRIDQADVLRAQRDQELQEMEKEAERERAVPLQKKVFTPKYAAVDTMKTELEKLKSERGKLTVIGNDIYVEEEPSILSSMQTVFDKNDEVAKQILIEARIVEALTSFTRNLGINWGGDARGEIDENPAYLYGAHSGGAIGAGGPAVNLISAPATGLALGFGLISEVVNLDAKLYALERTGEGRVVSAPRILASNDQEVYIKQGQSIPYESSGTTTSPSTITYNEAVLELKVKPHIEENGKIISMDIIVTKDTADFSRTTRNPPINKREAKTRLMLKNGETVVIGGIIVDEKSKTINRVPGLHRIPVLGWLFKSNEIADSKTELLIFLTSNIIPVNISPGT
jgi:type IV pilus assembly protein PilQ